MLSVEATALPDVKIISPKKFGDHRGFFSETYNRASFAEAGIDLDFVQDNHSLSATVGTLRGLHFQSPPFAQDKLVRVTQGPHPRRRRRYPRLLADLRPACRGRALGRELEAASGAGRLRPWLRHARAGHRGSLQGHGACIRRRTITASPSTIRRSASIGGMPHDKLVLSDKDRKHPRLADLPRYFD